MYSRHCYCSWRACRSAYGCCRPIRCWFHPDLAIGYCGVKAKRRSTNCLARSEKLRWRWYWRAKSKILFWGREILFAVLQLAGRPMKFLPRGRADKDRWSWQCMFQSIPTWSKNRGASSAKPDRAPKEYSNDPKACGHNEAASIFWSSDVLDSLKVFQVLTLSYCQVWCTFGCAAGRRWMNRR